MKFSVGYQLQNGDSLIKTINENKDKISEVYFSFGDFPNGRGKLNDQAEISFLAQQKQIEDLKKLGDMPLNLLLNGNCYGKYALARAFYNKVGDTVDYLINNFNLKTVTTTSPLIARFIKENFTLQTPRYVTFRLLVFPMKDMVRNAVLGLFYTRVKKPTKMK